MGKFKKEENLHGFISGRLKVLQKISEYEFAVELWMMRDGVNVNRWDFRNLEQHYQTFAGTPILIAYAGNQVGDGHNSEIKVDWDTGARYRSFMAPTAERIVGMISEEKSDLSLRKEGGYTWIVAKGRLWKVYAPELVEKIVRTGRMDVSVEVNVLQQHTEGDVEVITAWNGVGVTVLGDNVEPAIPGANIRALATLEDEFKKLKLRVASLSQAGNRREPQKKFTNKGVKKQMFENKTRTKELAAKFHEYNVLAYSEDGKNVCLMSKDSSETFAYSFEESDKGAVISERIRPVTLSAQVSFGEDVVFVPFDSVFNEMTARCRSLSEEMKSANARTEELEAKINEMNAREMERRKNASRQAAIEQLEEINCNKNEEEQIPQDRITAVLEAAQKGEFAGCAADNAVWNGEERAKSAVRDIAMQVQMEFDAKKANAIKAAKNKRYAFESDYNGKEYKNDSLEGIYARITG